MKSENMKRITCFIPYPADGSCIDTVRQLQQSGQVSKIYLLATEERIECPAGCETVCIESLRATSALREIAARADTPYTLLYTKDTPLTLGLFALERMLTVAECCGAGLVYADHYRLTDGVRTECPLIDCQRGSLRDDFDFGSLLLYRSEALKEAVARMADEYRFAALYDLRLKVSEAGNPVHINEFLYTEVEQDRRTGDVGMFDYVDPRNRAVQVEMEKACTAHLKEIGAWLSPVMGDVDLASEAFEHEASVIIPVRNRVRTIADAIRSVLIQETAFPFNLIVVDNHSTDGTTEVIRRFASSDSRVVLLTPERTDLGIGGCWNLGVHHTACGRFAVQLDSDDVYSDSHTLQKVVDTFRRERCAMVVGTYRMTDFDLNTLPPGVIDHREWTPENGHNNALRVNGLGAPRAFYTPLLRQVKLPDTSYGEDYAVGLALSRSYRIGRIYDVIYLCRRWEDNSDAALDREKMNRHNTYKDRLRTWELMARITLNRKK